MLKGKAHQRLIREEQARIEGGENLFGNYWEGINTDISNAVIKQISYTEAKTIILKYEWLGTMGSGISHCYGIYFDGQLAGCVCLGVMIGIGGYHGFVGEKYKKKGIQLSRGACVHWAHPHSASRLIGYALKDLKGKGYKFVIAFSDPDAGEIGTVYQATNWNYLGFGKYTGYNLIWPGGDLYMNDRGFRTKNKGGINVDVFLKENPHLGLTKKPVFPKARYMYLLGSKKEKKEMMKVLKSRIKPYPKRADCQE
jgi:hypothetical protein